MYVTATLLGVPVWAKWQCKPYRLGAQNGKKGTPKKGSAIGLSREPLFTHPLPFLEGFRMTTPPPPNGAQTISHLSKPSKMNMFSPNTQNSVWCTRFIPIWIHPVYHATPQSPSTIPLVSHIVPRTPIPPPLPCAAPPLHLWGGCHCSCFIHHLP